MNVSVIILTLNAQADIDNLFKILLCQTVLPREILILDNESTDDTTEVVKRYQRKYRDHIKLHTIPRHEYNHGGTRRKGVSLCSPNTDIFIMLAGDITITDNKFIETMISYFDDKDVASVYCRQIAHDYADPIEKHLRSFNYPNNEILRSKDSIEKSLGIKNFMNSDVAQAVRMSHYNKVGGYDENILTAEDVFLTGKFILKGGYKTIYTSKTFVFHTHNTKLLHTFRKYFDISASYKTQKWLYPYLNVSSSGINYVKDLMSYLIINKKYIWIPYAVVLTFLKFFGFKLGSMYNYLPKWLVLMITQPYPCNKSFWERYYSGK